MKNWEGSVSENQSDNTQMERTDSIAASPDAERKLVVVK